MFWRWPSKKESARLVSAMSGPAHALGDPDHPGEFPVEGGHEEQLGPAGRQPPHQQGARHPDEDAHSQVPRDGGNCARSGAGDILLTIAFQCYKEKQVYGEGVFVDMNFEFIEDTFNYRFR